MQKIIATVGPITSSEINLKKLIRAGADILRLNGSHSDLIWHKKIIKRIQKILPLTPIIFDIPGRKIRSGILGDGFAFHKNDLITLTTNKKNIDNNKIYISLGKSKNKLNINSKIYADDGSLAFLIKKVTKNEIKCKALSAGVIKSNKGFNFPDFKFSNKFLTKKDKKFVEFAIKNKVDFLGLSFVETGKNIEEVRKIIGKSKFPKIISKVENNKALENINEIIEKTDLIMIDRGDLGIETNIEEVVVNQKKIISITQKKHKPVIIATEMLHNMILNNYPTKAEISDITNACLDNCSATMLSGETAVSKNFVNNVLIMKKIITASNLFSKKENNFNIGNYDKIEIAIQNACLNLCKNLKIDKVIAITKFGYSARVLSLCNLNQPIIAVCPDFRTSKSLNILNNVTSVYVKINFEKKSTNHIPKCIIELVKKNILKKNELVLITYVGFPKNNYMNVLQTHYVKDFF